MLGSIAFPLISAGTFGFPKDRVLRIALNAISEFLRFSDEELDVYLCVYDRNAYELSQSAELKYYLNRFEPKEKRLKASPADRFKASLAERLKASRANRSEAPGEEDSVKVPRAAMPPSHVYDADIEDYSVAMPTRAMPEKLSDWIKTQDDSFALMLLKLIDKKGMTDSECYKKANVSRKTFWKINNDPNYRPAKPTILAFAIALELDLDETEQLLKTAGFSLSHSNVFDMIIEFYIQNRIYDVYEINSALYQYDQVCLGC